MSGARELRELYYQRIRPVVGELLLQRTVAVLDPGPLATVVDALARSGVLRWRIAAGGTVGEGSPLAVAFGRRWVG
ncbi:MAG: hypothetical protein FJ125_05065, partial [Deltaproteobacteria bacterium]|nr:hypothetical protein [Deltaproteobacteria bacterium]